ncbi:histone deacetylase RPD3 [Macrolepiota fuliginosa MF-IS2]|uniref:histone deacetylase n=1 Tax=Macrolepiota fuliginosa MF-IS2 TaxID=1400762 RepID=A0A9P6BY50_9AGAR|nr:histone deacetylase RPD3 [Macrolepiota fuliginosa MF-IS2]
MSKRKVAYYFDTDVGSYTYGLGHPMKPHRIRVTHDLVAAYDMLPKMHVLRAKRASPEMLTAFHTDEYIHFLTRVTPETAEELTYHGTRFLVGDDNPAFEGLFEFCSISAGGSICAAQRIASGAADIAINWAGGLHHAKKREASGFCYVNDIVLGILELLRSYPRVLYIDIDCHHGDGVEEAFYTTDRVMTCSFHKFGEYFPGTGTQEDRGRGKGKGYAINVPLKDGITDESFQSVFEPVIAKILDVFQPSAVILQCGADSLSGDKLGCFNLTMNGHAHCVQFLRKQNIPLILLGGGGYTVKNVARTWTYETACALGIENDIDPNLPWNEYFEWFAPRYRLEVVGNNMDDVNMKDGSLDIVRVTALEQLQNLVHAPSVQMHDVPKESIGHHLGFMKDEEGWDELDERLAQHARYVYTLQETSSASSDTDGEESWDSDDSSSSQWRRQTNGRGRSSITSKPTSSAAGNGATNGNVSGNGNGNGNGTNGSRKRMSLMTNRYFDVPAHENGFGHFECGAPLGKNVKRRFFNYPERWDSDLNGGLATRDAFSPLAKTLDLAGLMERGGRDREVDTVDDDWDDNNSTMAVDS